MNELRTYRLTSGAHGPDDGQQCVMEAETRFWGLNFTDSHPCISPVIGAFCRSWNDSLPSDAERERLLGQFIGRLAGTASTPKIELQRSWMALDWLVREYAAEFMALSPSLKSHADILRALPEIGPHNFDMVVPLVRAAWAAAGDAGAAAGAAAGYAARAAGAAAGDALNTSVARLQESAVKLLDRMIRLTEPREAAAKDNAPAQAVASA